MTEPKLTVGGLLEALEDFHPESGVSVRFVDSPPMRVEGVEVKLDKDGEFELMLVLPAQPTDSAVDSDMTRLCEKVMRGESTIFQVRFGMDLMEQCNAKTSEQRLRALSMYFAEAKRRVDEVIRFGREAGRVAQGEAAKDEEDDDFEAPDRRRGGPR